MIEMTAPAARIARPPRVFAGLLLVIGLALAGGGLYLALLDGSLYYVISGFLIVLAAVLLWAGRRSGAWLYFLVVLGTWGWAIWEVGVDAWQLVPRVLLLTALGLWLLTPRARRGLA